MNSNNIDLSKIKIVNLDMTADEIFESCVNNMLVCIGANTDDPGLIETPKRVRRAWEEIFEGMQYTNEEIAEDNKKCFDIESSDLVTCMHIKSYSMCEHHLLPMELDVSVGYIPENGKVLGLSKMARIVDMVCKRAQLQERIGCDVTEILSKVTGSDSVICVINGEHMCMTMRGIKKPGATTITSAVRGKFDTDADLRSEFFRMLEASK